MGLSGGRVRQEGREQSAPMEVEREATSGDLCLRADRKQSCEGKDEGGAKTPLAVELAPAAAASQPPTPPPSSSSSSLPPAPTDRALPDNVTVATSLAYRTLFTKMRDARTTTEEFVRSSRRAMRLLAEEALAELVPLRAVTIATPCGPCGGWEPADDRRITAVSIVRSGDCLVEAVREIEPGIGVGKILIQRDESTEEKRAVHLYTKLPPGIRHHRVLLCDPMLATGGSALEALRVLTQEFGVPPERVVFANVISCPEGLRNVSEAYSRLRRIVTAAVDPVLNGDKYIVPGLGDFGDRYYGTGGGEAAEADGDGDDGSGDGLRGGSAS